jgi:hypothetical protein
MNNSCTLNDLVLYLYNETELTDTVLIQHTIDIDEQVAETFNSMVAVKDLLDDSLVSPGKKALQNVLAYARSSALAIN